MNYPLISRLVDKSGFELMCWSDRYSKGVWAVCLPGYNDAQTVRDVSEDGDLDMIPATGYLLECEWLPVVTGRDLGSAMAQLESRLSRLQPDQLESRNSDWCVATSQAMQHLKDVSSASSAYGSLQGGYRQYRALPPDYTVVSRALEHQLRKGGEVIW